MTYKEAVELAKRQEEAGYHFLYESTCRDKYYIAMKYMQNEEDALDVLQDAYIRAFDKLDTLEDAEKFPAWFGMIVANTAKNALAKKKPVLFSEMAMENEDGDSFEYQIEDENIENQPELSFTQEETRELVQQLIQSLSEEQRLCILMFHIEDMSIKEIAETLGCSENTVKSRLNYGRKNLKAKAEELQKKGYKLYSMAPLPLLLYLLRVEVSSYTPAAGIAQMLTYQNFVGSSPAYTGVYNGADPAYTGDYNGADPAYTGGYNGADQIADGAANVAGSGVKQAFLHTIAGKIAVGIAATAMVAGITFAVIHSQSSKEDEIAITQGSEESTQVLPPDTWDNEGTPTDVTSEAAATTEEAPAEAIEYKQAYLKILQDKEEVINKYDYGNKYYKDDVYMQAEVLPVAITDINGDGVPELILQCVESASSDRAYVEIYTIGEDKNAKLIYSEAWDVFAGGGFHCGIFRIAGSDSLYFVKGIPGEAYGEEYMEMIFDEAGNVNTKIIMRMCEKIPYNDTPAYYIINGENVEEQVYQDKEQELQDKVSELCLCNDYEMFNDGVNKICMTYDDALRLLGGAQDKEEWKSAYESVVKYHVSWLVESQNWDASCLKDGDQNWEYALLDINHDGIPELIMKGGYYDWYWLVCTYTQADGVYLMNEREGLRANFLNYNDQLVWFWYTGYSEEFGMVLLEMQGTEIVETELYSGQTRSELENIPETTDLDWYSMSDMSGINNY